MPHRICLDSSVCGGSPVLNQLPRHWSQGRRCNESLVHSAEAGRRSSTAFCRRCTRSPPLRRGLLGGGLSCGTLPVDRTSQHWTVSARGYQDQKNRKLPAENHFDLLSSIFSENEFKMR